VPILQAARSVPHPLRISNDGLVCFLYDERNAEVIARSAAPLLERFDRDLSMDEPRLHDLALRGALVAYELYRDEPISVELSVGPAVTSREMRSGSWLAPQSAFIEIPSGCLRVDSYTSLPFGPRIPSERGGEFRVAPGRYVLTLLRFDWYGRRMFSRMFEDPPSEVIRLTPVEGMRLPARPRPMLLYPERPVAGWEGEWQVVEGEFHGQLVGEVGALNSVAINLDRDAAARIGLKAGMQIEARAGSHRFTALYAGDIRIDEILELHGSYTLAELRAASQFLAYMDHWQRPRRRQRSTVVVFSGGSTGDYDFSGLSEGTRVALKVRDDGVEHLRWA
jgi:hypothetical protein